MLGRSMTIILLAAAGGAWLVSAGMAAAEDSLLDLMRAHSECHQFNDGCSICRVENGAAVCSTPGIACIRTAWACADAGAEPSQQGGAPLAEAASIALAGVVGRSAVRLRQR
jgi:hypothetical protein